MAQQKRFQKKFLIQIEDIEAGIIILLATTLRVVLVTLGWTSTSGDEAMMNLAALHIEKNGEHPTFFYGQHYLGVLEAYVGSLLYHLFGASVLAMRLEMIAFTAGFFVCLYLIASKLYTKTFALLVLVIFFFGSQWTMEHQIQPTGYPELPFFVALIFLISYVLAASHYQLSLRKRVLLYLLWGLLVGLGLWVDLLIAPYVLVSGILILVFCWREVLKWGAWLVLLSLSAGAAPLIYYNVTAARGQNSIAVFLNQVSTDPHPGLEFHMMASIFYSLPLSLGYSSSTCISLQWGQALFSGPDRLSCELTTGTWGLGYLLLAGCALLLICLAFRKLYQLDKSMERHQQMAKQFARLMLLCGFAISFLAYERGNGVSIDPIDNWRYLICTWISLPAILWPLWTCDQWFQKVWARGGALALKSCVLLLLGFALISNTVNVFQQQVPLNQTKSQRLATLETTLEHMHMTRFYSEYWTCNPLIIETQEQLICGDTSPTLGHIDDRYLLYPALVKADPHPGFVYPDNAAQIPTLEGYLTRYHLKYERVTVPGYVIYQMYGHIPSLDL